jgi:transcription elongation factor Elf1
MGRCRCGGCVVFGTFAAPKANATRFKCLRCGHEWLDNGERCTMGLTDDVPVPWCPKCGGPVPPSHIQGD